VLAWAKKVNSTRYARGNPKFGGASVIYSTHHKNFVQFFTKGAFKGCLNGVAIATLMPSQCHRIALHIAVAVNLRFIRIQ